MKTLIVGINSKFIHSSLSVQCLKSYCDLKINEGEDLGDIEIKEFTINDVYDSILYGILSLKPDVCAISCYIWNINVVSRLVNDLKKINSDIIIVLGGPEVSYGIEHTRLKPENVDFIIKGEGEIAFYKLIKDLNTSGTSLLSSEIHEEIIDITDVPQIYDDKYFERNTNKIIYYESSRGCPYSCAYCLSARCGKVRYLSLDRVFSDIDMFIAKEVGQVKFVDRTFNANLKRAKEIFKYIIDKANDKDINFHFEIGGDLFDEESLDILEKAKPGLIQFEIGIQSTNEETLRASARYMPLDKIFTNVKRIMSFNNINMHLDLIIGLPYEPYDTFRKSFNDVYSLRPHQLQVGFLKLLKGSPMEYMVEEHGYVFSEFAPYEVLANKYISNEEIIFLKQFEDCFNMYYNSGRFSNALDYLVSFFEDAFSTYERLTLFFEKRNLTYVSMASRKLYDLIIEFVEVEAPDIDMERFKELLLLDFYCTDKSESVPLSLTDVADFSKESRNRIKEYLRLNYKKETEGYNKFIQGRLIRGKCFVFDYSKKNPVTERYDYKIGF